MKKLFKIIIIILLLNFNIIKNSNNFKKPLNRWQKIKNFFNCSCYNNILENEDKATLHKCSATNRFVIKSKENKDYYLFNNSSLNQLTLPKDISKNQFK